MPDASVYCDPGQVERISICTVSGREFKPFSPDPAAVHLGDIAHATAMKCRYTGHTRVF